MSTSKKRFILANPFDAKSLARMFEQLTGKQVSEAEIAAAQRLLDQTRNDATAPRRGNQSAPSTYRQCRSHRTADVKKRLH